MFDLKNNIELVECLNAIVKAADTNATGIDTKGFNSSMAIVNVGAPGITFSTTHKVDILLEDSSDNSTFAAVTDNNYVTGGTVGSTGIWQTIDADGDCNAVYGIGYVGPERYYRVVLDFSGTHGTGTIFGVLGAQSNPLHAPTTEGANL
mgnify:CR=1 FL=1|jgi:hypothetical protein